MYIFFSLLSDDGKCKCNICHKVFPKQGQLRLHFNIHYIERPHRCDSCGISFRTNGHLQKHKRSVSHFNKVRGLCLMVNIFFYCGSNRFYDDVLFLYGVYYPRCMFYILSCITIFIFSVHSYLAVISSFCLSLSHWLWQSPNLILFAGRCSRKD